MVDDFMMYMDHGMENYGREWFVGESQPLVLDEMSDYELDLYARDSQGNELSGRNAGRSTYAIDARVEAKAAKQEFSLDDLGTQVTGSVTAVHPRTGERLPLAGARVRAHLGDGWADAVSDAQGRFTTSVSALGTERDLALTASLASGDTEVTATVPTRIRAQKSALTMTSTAPLTARYGTGVPVRGKLTRVADDGTVKPAAGLGVAASGAGKGEAVTGADGSYTLMPPILRTGSVDVRVNSVWLLGDGTRTATVAKVTHMTKVVEEKLVSTTKYGKVTISGKVLVDGITSQEAPVEIQYRTSSGQWKTQMNFRVPYNKPVTLTVNTPLSERSEGWRVHTPGTKNIGPSTGTKVIPQTRVKTQLTDEYFKPSTVAGRKELTVGAILKTDTPTKGYVPYPGQKVRYYFKATPSHVWQEVGTSVSGADGAVSKKFPLRETGVWRIRFVDPDATHLSDTGEDRWFGVN
ncbi:hypothetical protein ACFVX6_31555 [Streptomyces sp. NPDC058289]|uniref:hypothetical protein n=1 Tax=Streptomyces sp. NPDC058289 TaxID=3346425 RepID=UPI0036E5CFA6